MCAHRFLFLPPPVSLLLERNVAIPWNLAKWDMRWKKPDLQVRNLYDRTS
jgi:hypothetical protein